MLDALLGRKFTVKCKQATKCINERLKPIRNRKQAMINFLRQDIAELLRGSHDSHALKRMNALIVEINHLACYDLIQRFCECISKHLPLMQKQRECPPEDREAVSTLIFAAARFSDLPELCHLRHAFMARYGGTMETYASLEFKDKLASKTFSLAMKIQLMRDIARELSVDWDSELFEYRITHPMAGECVREKDGKMSDGMHSPSVDVVKHVVTETIDVDVIGHEPVPILKTTIFLDEPENVIPHSPETSIPHYAKPKRNKNGNHVEDRRRKDRSYRISGRGREVLEPIDQEYEVLEAMKSIDNCRGGSKHPSCVNSEAVGIGAENWHTDETICSRPSRARGELNRFFKEGDDVIEKSISKDNSKDGKIMFSSMKQQKLNDADADHWHGNCTFSTRSSEVQMNYKGDWGQVVGHHESNDVDEPIKVSHSKPKGIEDATESGDSRMQAIGVQKPADHYNRIKVSPFAKAVKDTQLHDCSRDDVVKGKSLKGGKDADLAPQEGQVVEPLKSDHKRSFHMIPPPYVKRNVSTLRDDAKSSILPANEGRFTATDKSNGYEYGDPQKGELVDDDERLKLKSLRKHHKTSVMHESDSAIDGDQPMPRISHRRRRYAAQRSTFTPQNDYDSEEEEIDRLLIHYSRKKTPHQPRRHMEKTQLHLSAHVMDDTEARQHPNDKYHTNRPEPALFPNADRVDDNRTAQRQSDGRRYAHMAKSVEAPADHFVDDGGVRKHWAFSRHAIQEPESANSLTTSHGTNCDEAGPCQSNGGCHISRSEEASRSLPVEDVYHVAAGQLRSHHRNHVDKQKAMGPPARALSLPRNLVSPEGKVKFLTRAATMQPGSVTVSSPGGRLHPRPPDYEELAARIAALNNG